MPKYRVELSYTCLVTYDEITADNEASAQAIAAAREANPSDMVSHEPHNFIRWPDADMIEEVIPA